MGKYIDAALEMIKDAGKHNRGSRSSRKSRQATAHKPITPIELPQEMKSEPKVTETAHTHLPEFMKDTNKSIRPSMLTRRAPTDVEAGVRLPKEFRSEPKITDTTHTRLPEFMKRVKKPPVSMLTRAGESLGGAATPTTAPAAPSAPPVSPTRPSMAASAAVSPDLPSPSFTENPLGWAKSNPSGALLGLAGAGAVGSAGLLGMYALHAKRKLRKMKEQQSQLNPGVLKAAMLKIGMANPSTPSPYGVPPAPAPGAPPAPPPQTQQQPTQGMTSPITTGQAPTQPMQQQMHAKAVQNLQSLQGQGQQQ